MNEEERKKMEYQVKMICSPYKSDYQKKIYQLAEYVGMIQREVESMQIVLRNLIQENRRNQDQETINKLSSEEFNDFLTYEGF